MMSCALLPKVWHVLEQSEAKDSANGNNASSTNVTLTLNGIDAEGTKKETKRPLGLLGMCIESQREPNGSQRVPKIIEEVTKGAQSETKGTLRFPSGAQR